MKFDPPLLARGPVSGRIYVVTHGKAVPRDGERSAFVEATRKYDVTDQFAAMATEREQALVDGIAKARRRTEGLLDRVTFVEGLPRDAVALLDNLLDGLAASQAVFRRQQEGKQLAEGCPE